MGLPISFAPDEWRFQRLHALGLVAVAAAQAVALHSLGATLRRYSDIKAVAAVAGGAVLMAAIAVTAGASTSTDPYFYVLYAKAPTLVSAYERAPIPIPSGFEPLQHLREGRTTPSPPSIYGPMWLEVSRLALARTSNVAEAVLALRLVGVISIIAILWAARAAGAGVGVIGLIALNPALYHFGVVECHNDILAIAFTCVGLAAVRKGRFTAAAVAGAFGGLVKINFAAIALAALSGIGTARQRIGVAIGLLAAVVLGSRVLGGDAYIRYLVFRAAIRRDSLETHTAVMFHSIELVALAVAIIAIGLMSVANISWRRSIWTIPGTAVNQMWPWYTLWPLPIALRMGDNVAHRFLVALPVASLLLIRAFGLSLVGVGLNSVYFLFAVLYAFSELPRIASAVRAAVCSQRKAGEVELV
jgi:hypothetical protein